MCTVDMRAIAVAIALYSAWFFALSAILWQLWNKVMIKAFSEGALREITYTQSMGVLLFLGLFVKSVSVCGPV